MANSPIVGRVNATRFLPIITTNTAFTTSDVLPLTDVNASNKVTDIKTLSKPTQIGVPNLSAQISGSDAEWTYAQKLFSVANIGSSYSSRSELTAITDNIGTQNANATVYRTSGKMVTA